MRITIKNSNGTRELIVKVQYDLTDTKEAFGKDEYGRDVHYTWTEKVTTIKCHEYDPAGIPLSKTVFVGNAICDYHDKKRFSKKKGRNIAWINCLIEMVDKKFVTKEEAHALILVGTSCTSAVLDMTGNEVKITRTI